MCALYNFTMMIDCANFALQLHTLQLLLLLLGVKCCVKFFYFVVVPFSLGNCSDNVLKICSLNNHVRLVAESSIFLTGRSFNLPNFLLITTMA